MARSLPPILPAGALSSGAQPVFRGDGIVLRPFQPSDAALLLEAFQDPAIQLWHRRTIDSDAEARAWIAETETRWQQESAANWVVVDGDDPDADRAAGRVSLSRIDLDAGQGEVTYWVLPSHRGRGVATRATIAVARWAADGVGFQRLSLNHSVRNPASCRVAEAAGFGCEGTARRALLHDDGWHDMHLHARIATDPAPGS